MFTPKFEYTDLGNAQRWVSMFSQHFKRVPERNTWMCWDGTRWSIDNHGNYMRQTINDFLSSLDADAKEIAAALAELQKDIDTSSEKSIKNALKDDLDKLDEFSRLNELAKACSKWRKICQSKQRIDAMLQLAANMGASISYTEFDSKGKYLGVHNGVVNLATGEFVQNDPAYLITKSVAAIYDPKATCPNWQEFLNTVFEGDVEKIAFFQRVAGEALLGERCKTKLLMFIGDGANGKSTAVDTLFMLLDNYATTTNPDAITTGDRSNEYYLATLKGARLTVLNESRANAKLDNRMVKQLVDSGPVQARQIYGKPFMFQPTLTPIMTTNSPPIITSEYAINRRILCVVFTYQIPEAKRDPNFIKNRLQPELSGILNWALEGCKQYNEQGLNPPESILQSTREYLYEYDRVLKFINEELERDEACKISVKDFYALYLPWCKHHDFDPYSSKQLNQELRGMGFQVKISTGNVYYVFGLKRKQFATKNVIDIGNVKGADNALTQSLAECT